MTQYQQMILQQYWVIRAFSYGYYYIVYTCGYVIYEAPLWRSEGVARTLEIYEEAFEGIPACQRPSYIWADRSCGVSYYLKHTVSAARKSLSKYTKWLMDRFHGALSHTPVQEHCMEHCDVSKMDFQNHRNDLLNRFPGVWTKDGTPVGNSEAGEQQMGKIKGFGHVVQNMHIDNARFFLFWMSVDMNEELIRNNHSAHNPQPSVSVI